MYLTRMALNMARPSSLKLLSSPYRLHAAVEAAFPPGAERACEHGRILWRLDIGERPENGAWLYVVSPAKPDLTHVVEQAGWPSYPDWETKDYDPFLDRLGEGQTWAFRLKANPVRTVRVDQGKVKREGVVGKREGHVTADQQIRWLQDRSERAGFEIVKNALDAPELTLSSRGRDTFMRSGVPITLVTARYDGALRIVDADAFRRTLCFGIGHARSFGCGLLTVAPLLEDR